MYTELERIRRMITDLNIGKVYDAQKYLIERRQILEGNTPTDSRVHEQINYHENLLHSLENDSLKEVILAVRAQLHALKIKAQYQLTHGHTPASVLMLYLTVPEHFTIFCWHNPDEELLKLLRACHNCYINTKSEDEYPEEVRKFITDPHADHRDKIVYTDDAYYQDPPGSLMTKLTSLDCEIIVCGFAL